MNFDWLEYLKFAEELSKAEHSAEVHQRSAISRAYYAAFNFAKEKIQEIDPSQFSSSDERDGKIHAKVRDYFRNKQDPFKYSIYESLNQLRDYRNSADYDKAFPHDLKKATQLCLGWAKQIISKVGNIK